MDPPRGTITLQDATDAMTVVTRISHYRDRLDYCSSVGIDYERLMIYYGFVIGLQGSFGNQATTRSKKLPLSTWTRNGSTSEIDTTPFLMDKPKMPTKTPKTPKIQKTPKTPKTPKIPKTQNTLNTQDSQGDQTHRHVKSQELDHDAIALFGMPLLVFQLLCSIALK
jgi:hypothetical protein